MKHNALFALCLCLLTAFAGCKGKTAQHSGTADTVATVTDSVVVQNGLGSFRYVAEVPRENQPLRDLVVEWISEVLGGYYQGSADSIAPVLRLAKDSAMAQVKANVGMLRTEDADTPAGSSGCSYIFRKISDGADYVTWAGDGYTYFEGSAHGTAPCCGQTFRKHDGRRIGWEVLRTDYDAQLQKLMREGLKQALGMKTDEELKQALLNEDDFEVLPLPQCPPLFTREGVKFVYQQYEIMPYALGRPEFTLSYDRLRPYMKTTALRLMAPKDK